MEEKEKEEHKMHLSHLEVVELNVLNRVRAGDFEIRHVVGMGQNGLVVAAKCTHRGLPDPEKLYAVKLLFNFTHEYSSIVRNAYENEWLVLSRLLPHDNVVRFWAQFICIIPECFARLLPTNVRKFTTYRNKSGEEVRRKGQFLVLDYHPQDIRSWTLKLVLPLPYETTLRYTEQLLEGVLYLEKCLIRHLDLKTTNLLLSDDDRIVLCDFGCAVQFPNDSFSLPYARGMLPGGNKAHLAPEVLNSFHQCRVNPSRAGQLDYSLQTSFAAGVLVYEIATGEHPLPDYPLGYTNNGVVSYSVKDCGALPLYYPKSFCSIISDLLHTRPDKRLPIAEALKQLRLCCVRKQSTPSVSSLQMEVERVKQERDLAKVKLSVVASERDFAVSEMRQMAEQCQTVAAEFDHMADHCDQLLKELDQVRHERDSALRASESAYEASELLQRQVSLVRRERDIAQEQLEELRRITLKFHLEETIRECGRCQRFYLESENGGSSCQWHPGVGHTTCSRLTYT